jgi:hypothetical protein
VICLVYVIQTRFAVVLSACMFADLLLPMFDDEYYPDILVAEVKQHVELLLKNCKSKI